MKDSTDRSSTVRRSSHVSFRNFIAELTLQQKCKVKLYQCMTLFSGKKRPCEMDTEIEPTIIHGDISV